MPAPRLTAEGHKYCPQCKSERLLDAFGFSKGTRDGRHGWCRDCTRARCRQWNQTKGQDPAHKAERRAYAKRYREKNREAVNRAERERHYKKAYGLTAEEYLALTVDANCGICGRTDDLCIDHDHKTGVLRGVLCRGCNAAIGKLGDTEQGVGRALAYLKAEVEQPV